MNRFSEERASASSVEHAIMKARCRVVIEGVTPEIDGGHFPIKRTPAKR